MTKLKVDSFLDLVRRSELVERDQLNRVLLKLKEQAEGKPIHDTDFVATRLVEEGLLTRWQADRLLEGRYKSFYLGKYKLLGHLGTGGMSNVYLAEHVLMRRRVAIKVLPKHRVNDSSYLARFRREAEAVAAVDHRNIVRAYDVDSVGDVHYLVMEYVEGRDLQVMVTEQGALDYVRAADYIRQAAQGLEHAHQAGLIHRDIKPANLLVDQHNVVKVLDLGLARFTDEDSASLTVRYDENVLGTADYLSPEQAVDSHGVDGRADIYSLGCSLYFLLCGNPPFPDGTLPQRLMMHQKASPPDIRIKRPDAPDDLIEICARMMAKKAEARYQTAQEVVEVLADWLRSRGHAVDSGIGSSGRLMHPGSGRIRATRPEQAASSNPRHTSAGLRAGILAATADSGVIGTQSPQQPAAADTESSRNRPTIAGGESAGRRPGRSASPRDLSPDPALPVAKALKEADPLAEVFAEIDAPGGLQAMPLGGSTPRDRTESAGAGQLYGRYVTSVGSTADGQSKTHRKRSGAPPWLWPLIIGGCMLALVLVLLGILLSLWRGV
jgi:eukaryotic-like serine/threonine-protein kinase